MDQRSEDEKVTTAENENIEECINGSIRVGSSNHPKVLHAEKDEKNEALPTNEAKKEKNTKLSKNAQKRLRKKEIWEEVKKRKKEAKIQRRIEKGTVVNDSKEVNPERAKRRREEKELFLQSCQKGIKVAIDCSFEDQMTDRENNSLAQQIMHCYGKNKRAAQPSTVLACNVKEGTRRRLENISGFKHWVGVEIKSEDYLELFPKDKLVYLTGDASEELERFDSSEVYIIGGIVDRNRLKGATITKAQDQGLRTARLPLDRIGQLEKSTKHLTINQVFEIVLNYNSSQSFEKAFIEVIPSRKHLVLKSNNCESDPAHAIMPENIKDPTP